MNIAEILLQRAEELRDAAVLVDVHKGKDRSISYGELDRATAGVAHQLREAGLQQGDGMLLLHPVAAELYIFLIALFRVGCVAIFLDPSAGRKHIARCCEIFPPKALFGSPRAQLLRWRRCSSILQGFLTRFSVAPRMLTDRAIALPTGTDHSREASASRSRGFGLPSRAVTGTKPFAVNRKLSFVSRKNLSRK